MIIGNVIRFLSRGYSEGRASAFHESAELLRETLSTPGIEWALDILADELDNRAGLEQGWHGDGD